MAPVSWARSLGLDSKVARIAGKRRFAPDLAATSLRLISRTRTSPGVCLVRWFLGVVTSSEQQRVVLPASGCGPLSRSDAIAPTTQRSLGRKPGRCSQRKPPADPKRTYPPQRTELEIVISAVAAPTGSRWGSSPMAPARRWGKSCRTARQSSSASSRRCGQLRVLGSDTR